MNNRKKLISLLALLLAAVMVLSMILGIIPSASAASSSEIKNQITQLEKQQKDIRNQMTQLEDQYEETEDELANIISQKQLLDQEIFLLYAQIENVNTQIGAYNLLIADKQDELEQAQDKLNALNEEHKDRIRTMEEEGSVSYWSVIFRARSFSDLLDRLIMVQEIAASDQRRLDSLRDAAQAVAQAQEALELEREALQDAKDTLDSAYAELETKRQEQETLIQELKDKAKEIEGLQEQLEAEDEALLLEIAQQEKAYNEAKYQEYLAYMATYTTAPPPTTQPPETTAATESSPEPEQTESTQAVQTTEPAESTEATEATESTESTESTEETQPASVTWLKPCSYTKVSSPFGNRISPTSGASNYHQGIDLSAAEGTPIYASRSGTVTIAKYSKSAGYYVSINHGDRFASVYMHMTNYIVSVGQKVSAGEVIGYVGSTGISTGPHLHFGISYDGVYVNPALYISF